MRAQINYDYIQVSPLSSIIHKKKTCFSLFLTVWKEGKFCLSKRDPLGSNYDYLKRTC